MAIVINGKTYRNLQEQVKKNMDDIEDLQSKIIDPDNFVSIDTDQTITGEKTFDSNINIINSHDIVASTSTVYFGNIYENGHDISDVYATKDDVYTKTDTDAKFATKVAYVSKSNLTDYSINDIIVADSEIQSGEVDLRAVSAQDVKSELSLDPTSAIIKTTSGTNNSTIGISGTEVDITTGTLKYNSNEVLSIGTDDNLNKTLIRVNQIAARDGEETDNKGKIYLNSGIRTGSVQLQASGEESGASLLVRGTSAIDSEGLIEINGQTTFNTANRINVYDGSTTNQLAYLSDIPASVSGINNGTNWTSITIGNDTYGIPTGGSGSIVAGTGIDITNGVVSVDNTVAMKTDELKQYLAVLEFVGASSNKFQIYAPAYAPANTTFTGTVADLQYIYVGSSGAVFKWNSSASQYTYSGVGMFVSPIQFVILYGGTVSSLNNFIFSNCTFTSITFTQPQNITFTE